MWPGLLALYFNCFRHACNDMFFCNSTNMNIYIRIYFAVCVQEPFPAVSDFRARTQADGGLWGGEASGAFQVSYFCYCAPLRKVEDRVKII